MKILKNFGGAKAPLGLNVASPLAWLGQSGCGSKWVIILWVK